MSYCELQYEFFVYVYDDMRYVLFCPKDLWNALALVHNVRYVLRCELVPRIVPRRVPRLSWTPPRPFWHAHGAAMPGRVCPGMSGAGRARNDACRAQETAGARSWGPWQTQRGGARRRSVAGGPHGRLDPHHVGAGVVSATPGHRKRQVASDAERVPGGALETRAAASHSRPR